jgi:hypothetical protein
LRVAVLCECARLMDAHLTRCVANPCPQVFTADGNHLALAALVGPVHLVTLATGAITHVFRSHLTPSLPRLPRVGAAAISLPPVTHVCVSQDRCVTGARPRKCVRVCVAHAAPWVLTPLHRPPPDDPSYTSQTVARRRCRRRGRRPVCERDTQRLRVRVQPGGAAHACAAAAAVVPR